MSLLLSCHIGVLCFCFDRSQRMADSTCSNLATNNRNLRQITAPLVRAALRSRPTCLGVSDRSTHRSTLPWMFIHVKVYKTSILVFKDRARYVEGEFRFRQAGCNFKKLEGALAVTNPWQGYCKGNPRKMVAQWAEKERAQSTCQYARFFWLGRWPVAEPGMPSICPCRKCGISAGWPRLAFPVRRSVRVFQHKEGM